MDKILDVKNLSKTYSNFSLKDISFAIPKGCIMGLIGENGAGKTTTLKLILNLIKKEQGEISIFGLDNVKYEKEIKEKIGIILEGFQFYEELNAHDIAKILKNIYQAWDKDKYTAYLLKFNLPSKKKIRDFSQGMKAKLSLAVSLAHDPDLLILDEPTASLDPIIRNEILDIFLDFIQNENKSILFSTHITSDLDKIADYITFIHEGQIIFSDGKDELLDKYGLLKCSLEDFTKLDRSCYLGYRQNEFGYEALLVNKHELARQYPDLIIDPANMEDIMLYHVRRDNNERLID